MVADYVAKFGRNLSQTHNVCLGSHYDFDKLVWLDKIGHSLERSVPNLDVIFIFIF